MDTYEVCDSVLRTSQHPCSSTNVLAEMHRKQGRYSRLPTMPLKPELYPEGQKLRISWSIPTESSVTNTWVEVQPVGDSDWQHVGTAPAWATSMLIESPSQCSAVQARVKMQTRNGWGSYSCPSQSLILIPSVVRLALHSLSGKQVELEVVAASDVAELKEKVASLWYIPPICQQLAIGANILYDAETWAMVHMQQVARNLQEYIGPDMPTSTLHVAVLDVTLVTDHRALCAVLVKSLSSRSKPSTRTQARNYLLEWARKDLNQPLSMCIMLLQAPNHHVRRTAMLTLGQIAPPGEETTINALLDCDRKHWSVRAALLEVLPKLAGKGNQHVVATLIEGLFDASPWVSLEACESLMKYTSKGDEFAMVALEDALNRTPAVPNKKVMNSVCTHLLPAEARPHWFLASSFPRCLLARAGRD